MGNAILNSAMEVQQHANYNAVYGFIFNFPVVIMDHSDGHVFYWYLDFYHNSIDAAAYYDYFHIYH